MGIQGLATYIAKRSDQYLEPFDLHDTYLVVDGHNVGYKLYERYTKGNCAFGGDYDKYAQCLRKFFNGLQKCNITPLVVIDGVTNNEKLQNTIERQRGKTQVAKSYTPLCQDTLNFFPALLMRVFKSVIKEMGIRHMQCIFEDDSAIASVAKSLNCPVLSEDSDFYIYGVSYIPFKTIDINITQKLGVYVKCCKIYRFASLLNTFPGLDESVLPLAAVLICNNYMEQKVFNYFYLNVKLPKKGLLNHNQLQCLIEGTLHWLSKQKLNNAIIMIMAKVAPYLKKKIYKKIKMVMNKYNTNLSIDILNLLGFSKEDIEQITSKNVKYNFNIQADKNYLDVMEDLAKIVEMTPTDESEFEAESDFIKSLPSWYIDEQYKALLPCYFMSMFLTGFYVTHVQIEDYRQPSSFFISEKILNVIFTLLTSGFRKNYDRIEYLTRGKNDLVTRFSMKYIDDIFPFDIPLLHDLRTTSITVRRDIFDITLGITQDIDEFPINWRLYIGTAKYWIEHLTKMRSDSHIYALLFAMLHHIIDVNIGYYRCMHEFQSKYKEQSLTLESKKKTKPNNLSDCTHMSIIQAVNAVEIDDCILLAPFFINNSEMDRKLYTNSKEFDTSIVHLFAQFQNCIEQSFNLNVLLGFPYEVTSISNMYNGTLLYNLYNNFSQHDNIENYINLILQCSPTLSQLFNLILIKAKKMFNICATQKESETKSEIESDTFDSFLSLGQVVPTLP